jgi:hypothetical protein
MLSSDLAYAQSMTNQPTTLAVSIAAPALSNIVQHYIPSITRV